MTCQDSFHEVAFNISFWTRNISSARILFWRGVSSTQLPIFSTIATKNKCRNITKNSLMSATLSFHSKLELFTEWKNSKSEIFMLHSSTLGMWNGIENHFSRNPVRTSLRIDKRFFPNFERRITRLKNHIRNLDIQYDIQIMMPERVPPNLVKPQIRNKDILMIWIPMK